MIQIKCSNCKEEFPFNKDKCPYCGDPVKTSWKFFCGTCETEMKIGEEVCKKCKKKPAEIIIEKSDGKRITTQFDTNDSTDENYIKYVIIPRIIYWGIPIVFGIYLATSETLSLCSLDSNCGDGAGSYGLIGFIIAMIIWLFFTWPGLFLLHSLNKKYLALSESNNKKK